ncbi:hypothetical protein ASPCAL06911 [Aspergillus calidoustus]|uniref:CFEM domain-containing protein n=1 Tax=Aspergillus calidoustus TaxID=454130 RepID=A0A0U5GXE1_ASPCI|nr:hypothetical protein ASPCAL06911 [Aspergillus calidoustus]
MSQGFLSFRSARSAGLAFFCFYLFWTLGSAVTVTLSEDPAYETLRPCAQSCFFAGVYDRVANVLGCTTDPDPENACYCRPDLQSAATDFLEDCVDESCGQNMDVTSALSIYSAYCSRNNFEVASTTADSTPTSLPTNSDAENISTTSTRTVAMFLTQAI